MTQDEIIRMAREAGIGGISEHYGFVPFNSFGAKELKRFAALVAAQEREACAKVCDEIKGWPTEKVIADECAAAIRARNNHG